MTIEIEGLGRSYVSTRFLPFRHAPSQMGRTSSTLHWMPHGRRAGLGSLYVGTEVGPFRLAPGTMSMQGVDSLYVNTEIGPFRRAPGVMQGLEDCGCAAKGLQAIDLKDKTTLAVGAAAAAAAFLLWKARRGW